MTNIKIFSEFKHDAAASIVVFFVALPLCLGIALASGAPLASGIIAGIIGGIVVGILSGSQLGVSGPAAGLTVVVAGAISSLGSWEAFLTSLVIAGIIQLTFGYFKFGFIAYFFPSSVIKGMLTGIGLLIILKQIPHALGYDAVYWGEEEFFQANGETTLQTLQHAFALFTPGAIIVSVISLGLLIFWEVFLTKKHRLFEILQGPIAVVFIGVLLNYVFHHFAPGLSLSSEHTVNIDVGNSFSDLTQLFSFPDWSALRNLDVYKMAFVLAVIASLETLLCVEATDKLDPMKRITPTNQELRAQGVGNLFSGLIGGLPVTQVIVRSTANITFGARTKLSTILHGFYILISIGTIVPFMNMIPLASLASILIIIGYKLAKPTLFRHIYRQGWEQFLPFMITIIMILATNLLNGVLTGLLTGLVFSLHHSYRNSYYIKDETTLENGNEVHHIILAEEVSFFNKASIIEKFKAIPDNAKVIIDCSNSKSIAHDVVEIILDFRTNAPSRNINVELINFVEPAYV